MRTHRLDAGAVVRELAAGELLFRQGDPAVAIFRVESGQLRLVRRTTDDHLVILHTARRGELFAEAALFAGNFHCDALAVVPSRVRIYSKKKVKEALRADSALSEEFTAGLARQLHDLRAKMELRNIRSARERLMQYLRLRAGSDARSIPIEGRLQDMAAEVGLTREVLYRTLAALETEGWLVRTAAEIRLSKPDKP